MFFVCLPNKDKHFFAYIRIQNTSQTYSRKHKYTNDDQKGEKKGGGEERKEATRKYMQNGGKCGFCYVIEKSE